MARYQVTISVVQIGSKDLTEVKVPTIPDGATLLTQLAAGLDADKSTFQTRDDSSPKGRFSSNAAGYFLSGKVEF